MIISGRARTSVLDKLRGVRAARVIGNHGAETEGISKKSQRHVKRWKADLELELSGLPGLWVEDNGLSLAVHYRQSRSVRKIDLLRSAPNNTR